MLLSGEVNSPCVSREVKERLSYKLNEMVKVNTFDLEEFGAHCMAENAALEQ